MGSDTFYNERRFLWGVVRFVWAVTCVRRIPRRRRGRGCRLSLPRHMAAEFSMGSDTFYNERRFPWGVIRFVWAVTGIRTAPPVRAEEGAGSACRASPLSCRVPPIRRARRLLWALMRFVFAVACVRIVPPVRAEEGAGSACRPALSGKICGKSCFFTVSPLQ